MVDTDKAIKAAVEAANATVVTAEVRENTLPTTFFPTAEEVLAKAREELDTDLKTIIDCKDTPQMKAKMTRASFSSRGWPDEEHPGTVRDFLEKFGVPVIDSTVKLREAAKQVSETKSGE